MPKIILQKLIKYNGEKVFANTPFECTEEELPEFQAMGCHVFKEAETKIKTKKSE